MVEVKDMWNPTGFHGELAVKPEDDVLAAINEAIHLLQVPGYRDIKFCRRSREDGTTLIFFELIR